MKLHFACGTNYVYGWTNVEKDMKYRADIYVDLSKPFPFESNSAEAIISQHFIEHLTEDEGEIHFRECYRVLKSDGIMRISCPDLFQEAMWYIQAKKENKICIGGIETNQYITASKSFNINWTDWGHKYNYDFEDLYFRLNRIGFKNIIRKSYKEMNPTFIGVEINRIECLCVEVTK